MTYDTLLTSIDARGVVDLRLNRPEKRNAIDAQMIAELTDFVQSISKEPKARVVVIRGEGSVFCAGGDLGWMHAQIKADRAGRIAEARKLALMLNALNTMPLPLIGYLHGGAFGGGVGLACVCDVAVAEIGTAFGLTETRLGLIPATIGPYVVARLGEGMARRVFMSSRVFKADEAQALGLIAKVVTPAQTDAIIEAEVSPYLQCARGAIAEAKALTRALGPVIDNTVIDATIIRLADIWEAPEAAKGIAAFLSKKNPHWT